MSYTLAPPSTTTRRTNRGILLNANCDVCTSSNTHSNRHHHSSFNSPHSRSLSPSSSTTSSSQSASEDSSRDSPKRRITFAPLPKPRADSDNHSNVPIIVLHNDDQDSHIEALPSLSGDDSAIEPSSSAYSPRVNKKSPWSTKKLLKSLYQTKKTTNDSDAAGPSASGSLGLFRPSSRDSTASSQGTLTDSAAGAPLRRRMSTGSSPYSLGPTNHVVDDAHLALAPTLSENGGTAIGTRLPNGRVYGSSRIRRLGSNSVPSSATKHEEPEFVEWGYGGMGSNNAHSASSKYAKLQSGQKNVVAHHDEDLDDGSGMGWVRKRREAREREKREREEKENLEQNKDNQASTTTTEKASSSVDTLPDTVGGAAPAMPSRTPSMATDEHITQAVTVPIRPSSGSKPSRGSSFDRHPATPVSGRSTPSRDSIGGSTITSALRIKASPGTSSPEELAESSTESSDDEGANTTEKDEDDEEDEEALEASIRKTSACAGVEKISRHKE